MVPNAEAELKVDTATKTAERIGWCTANAAKAKNGQDARTLRKIRNGIKLISVVKKLASAYVAIFWLQRSRAADAA